MYPSSQHVGMTSWRLRLVARVYEAGYFILRKCFHVHVGDAPLRAPRPTQRAPRMWGVERDPRASLGAHGDGLAGVFGAVSVAAVVESLRGRAPWAPWESPYEFLAARARPWASPTCGRSRGITWCLYASGNRTGAVLWWCSCRRPWWCPWPPPTPPPWTTPPTRCRCRWPPPADPCVHSAPRVAPERLVGKARPWWAVVVA